MVAPASTCSAGGFSLRHDPRKERESHTKGGGPVRGPSPNLFDSQKHSVKPRASKICSRSNDPSALYPIWEVLLTHKHGSIADPSGKCRHNTLTFDLTPTMEPSRKSVTVSLF